jgi:undecaprenyl diphosphate synthase
MSDSSKILESAPKHIGIIMDGNGRWANGRSHSRIWGHIRGATRVRPVVKEAESLGVKALTLYTFSSENWGRPKSEISLLMKLLQKYLRLEVPNMKKENMSFGAIGDRSKWPEDVRKSVEWAEDELKDCTGFRLTFAFSYGSQDEILTVIRSLCEKSLRGEINPSEIDIPMFESLLYTSNLPQLDLVIRTGGEKRLSNFLLWQAAYSEFWFTEKAWPEFQKSDLREAVEEFKSRQRRFGLTGSQTVKQDDSLRSKKVFLEGLNEQHP